MKYRISEKHKTKTYTTTQNAPIGSFSRKQKKKDRAIPKQYWPWITEKESNKLELFWMLCYFQMSIIPKSYMYLHITFRFVKDLVPKDSYALDFFVLFCCLKLFYDRFFRQVLYHLMGFKKTNQQAKMKQIWNYYFAEYMKSIRMKRLKSVSIKIIRVVKKLSF